MLGSFGAGVLARCSSWTRTPRSCAQRLRPSGATGALSEASATREAASPGVEEVSRRCQFNLECVIQLIDMFEETEWQLELTTKQRSFLLKKHSRLLASQICEDSFNRMKKAMSKHENRRLNIAASYDVLQQKHVVDAIHRFDSVAQDMPSAQRSDRIPHDAFDGPVVASTVDLSGIATCTAKASWYSPGASSHGVAYLDSVLMQYVNSRKCSDRVKDCWLNNLLKVQHHLIVREVLPGGGYGAPVFACTALPGSVGVGWPAVESLVPGAGVGDATFFLPKARQRSRSSFRSS